MSILWFWIGHFVSCFFWITFAGFCSFEYPSSSITKDLATLLGKIYSEFLEGGREMNRNVWKFSRFSLKKKLSQFACLAGVLWNIKCFSFIIKVGGSFSGRRDKTIGS